MGWADGLVDACITAPSAGRARIAAALIDRLPAVRARAPQLLRAALEAAGALRFERSGWNGWSEVRLSAAVARAVCGGWLTRERWDVCVSVHLRWGVGCQWSCTQVSCNSARASMQYPVQTCKTCQEQAASAPATLSESLAEMNTLNELDLTGASALQARPRRRAGARSLRCCCPPRAPTCATPPWARLQQAQSGMALMAFMDTVGKPAALSARRELGRRAAALGAVLTAWLLRCATPCSPSSAGARSPMVGQPASTQHVS